MAILKNRKQEMYDHVVNDLIMEFTVGGDRFDSDDINCFIENEGLNREIIYNRLKERQKEIDRDSTRDLGSSILPDVFFRQMAKFWVFKKFDDSLTSICKDHKYNYIKPDGNLLSPDLWFDSISSSHNGIIKVAKDGKYNFLKSDGSLVSSKWFDNTLHFYEDYAVVERDGQSWYIDRNNRSLTGEQTFKNAESFYNGMAVVTGEDGMKSYINKNGELKGSANDLMPFRGESAFASWCADSWYLVDKEFNILNTLPVNDAYVSQVPSLHMVMKNIDGKEKFNIMHDSGKFLLEGWVDYLMEVSKGGRNIISSFSEFVIDQKFVAKINEKGVISENPELAAHLKGCVKLQNATKESSIKMRRQ